MTGGGPERDVIKSGPGNEYNFLLAEERKKQKMFSHTLLGASPIIIIGQCGLGKHILLLLPPLLDLFSNKACFIHTIAVNFPLFGYG